MTLATLSLLGLTATLLAIKVSLIVIAVVWAFGGSFRPDKGTPAASALAPTPPSPEDLHPRRS